MITSVTKIPICLKRKEGAVRGSSLIFYFLFFADGVQDLGFEFAVYFIFP